MTNKTQLAITATAVAAAFLTLNHFVKDRPLTEAERIAAANAAHYQLIFHRCQHIPELHQFIDLFNPPAALEFFDNESFKEVVSVTAVADPGERYQIAVTAPVTLHEDGYYELTGEPAFVLKDKHATFIERWPNCWSEGPGLRFGSLLWRKLHAANGDFEVLREIDHHPLAGSL